MIAVDKAFSVKHIICLLGNRNYADLEFRNGCAYVYSREAGEIVIEAPEGHIPDEAAKRAADVLEHLDACTEQAQSLLGDVKIDLEAYPHALDKGFRIYGIYFGHYSWGDSDDPVTEDGFVMTFTTAEYYPLDFTVKFHYRDMRPVSLEVWGS